MTPATALKSKPRRRNPFGRPLRLVQRPPEESEDARRWVRARLLWARKEAGPMLATLTLYREAPKGACALCWRDMLGGEHGGRVVYTCSRQDTQCGKVWHRLEKARREKCEATKAALLEGVAA